MTVTRYLQYSVIIQKHPSLFEFRVHHGSNHKFVYSINDRYDNQESQKYFVQFSNISNFVISKQFGLTL